MSATVSSSVPQTLAGKVAIVTGASSGMGRDAAIELARRGAAVVVGARRVDKLATLVDEIKKFGGKAVAAKLDVNDEKDQQNIVKLAVDTFGHLDIAFNNAGIFRVGSILEQKISDVEEVLRTNVIGVFLGIKHQAVAMKNNKDKEGKQKGGVIINNGSSIALKSTKVMPGTAYATSKWAVEGLTENAAVELSDFGIRVVSVNPGVTVSEMVPEEKGTHLAAKMHLPGFNTPILGSDIAKAVAFLASDDARFITSTSLVVAGGVGKRG